MHRKYILISLLILTLIGFVHAEDMDVTNQSQVSGCDPGSCLNQSLANVTIAETFTAQENIPSNETLCSARALQETSQAMSVQSYATNTIESLSSPSDWDVAVRFDNAPGNSFYPFSSSPGIVGTPYYAKLDSSDNNLRWIPYCFRGCGWEYCYWANIARQPCEQLSTPCDSLDPAVSGCICYGGKKNAARIDGWFVERQKITDTKYRLKIRGQSIWRADPRGALWLNPDSGWKFTQLNSCGVQQDQGYPPRPTSCGLTSDTMLQFQAAGDCGSACACEDAGSVYIDVIAERIGIITPTPTPTPVPRVYSMTNVETFPGKMNLAPKGTFACDEVQRDLSDWSPPKFYKRDSAVTKADFGSQGLATSTFHYHYGHGDKLLFGTGVRLTNDWVQPLDVYRAWNGKNKWVLIDACNILSDPNWGNAMVTTHGILGFTTEKPSDWRLPQAFLPKVKDGSMTVYDAYFEATTEAYKGTGYRAAVIFHNQNQLENDHFPPGYVAPDGSPNDKPVYKPWEL